MGSPATFGLFKRRLEKLTTVVLLAQGINANSALNVKNLTLEIKSQNSKLL